MPFAAVWMDTEIIVLHEVSQTQTNVIWYHLHIEWKKSDTNELLPKTELDPQTQKTDLCLPKGKGRDKLGVYIYTLLYIKYKIDNQQGPIV